MRNGKRVPERRLSLATGIVIVSAAMWAFGIVASGALGSTHHHRLVALKWYRYSLSTVGYLNKKELRPLLHGQSVKPGSNALKRGPKHPYVPVPKATVNHTGVRKALASVTCTLPGAPGSPAATGGANQASISWTAASGSPTAYVVTAYSGTTAENAIGTPASATTQTLTGLAGGTYTFHIFAQNACGNGPAATTSAKSVTGTTTYASDVVALHPSAYFRLGEASGTVTAADSSGHGLLGSYISDSSVQLGQTGALPSDTATSVSDNDGNWVANVPGPTNLPTGNSARTIQAWVKRVPTDNTCRWVIGYGPSSSYLYSGSGFSLGECTNSVLLSTYQNDLSFPTPEPLGDGQWHLITVTYNGTSATAYEDTRSLGTKTFSIPLSTANGGLALGSYDSQCCPSFTYGGLQDEAVYPTALTSAQITTLFNASGYGKPTTPGSPAAASSTNNASVTWTASSAPGTSLTGYIVTAKKGTAVEQSIAAPGSATNVAMTGLPAATYTFTVTAIDAYGSSTAATTSSVLVGGNSSTYASTVLGDLPAVFYRLGEPSGSTLAADSSGKNVTAFYAQSCITQGIAGPLPSDLSTAVSTSSCNNVASEATKANLPAGTATRTLQAWVKPSDTGCRYFAGYGGNYTDGQFSVGNCGNSVLVSLYSDDHSFFSPRNIADGNWHLITAEMTYSTTTGTSSITAYLDGQKLGTQTANAPNTQVGTGMDVGNYPNGCCYDGGIADLAVYPSALSVTQINALMTASGNATPAAPTGVTATGGSNKATIDWTAPGGSVSYYIVTQYKSGVAQQAITAPGTATSATIDSLANDGTTGYTFKVVAYNTYGAGTASAATSPATVVSGATSTYASTVLASTPVLYYRLGETGNVPVAADSSGSGTPGYFCQGGGVTQGIAGAINDGTDLAASQSCSFLVDAPGSTKVPADDSARTVEAWFKPSDSSCSRNIVSFGSNNTDQAFGVNECPNAILVTASGDDHWFYTKRPVNDGAWHFVAVTYNDASGVDQLTVYVDGVSLGTQSFNNTLQTPPTSTLWIGTGANNCCVPFYGGLDEVAVFASALSSSAIASQFTIAKHAVPGAPTGVGAVPGTNRATVSWTAASSSDPITGYVVTAYSGTAPGISEAVPGSAASAVLTGLKAATSYTFKVVAYDAYGQGAAGTSSAVSPTGSANTFASTLLGDSPLVYYRLAEPAGSTLAGDSSGKGNTGVYNASVTTFGNTSALPSDTGTSVSDNGNNSVAYDQNEPQTRNLPGSNQPRTLLAWVKLGDTTCRYAMGYGNTNISQGFGMAVCPNEVGVIGWSDDEYFPTTEPLNDGNWHQIAITYDGTNERVYVDGNPEGALKPAITLNTAVGAPLYIGSGPQNAGYDWYGGLAHAAVFGTALSAAQIQALFAASGYSVPTAPGSAAATGGTNKATITWSAASATHATITGYVVTAYNGSTRKNSVATSASATSVTIKGLANASYTFKVAALDQYGTGPAATTSSTTVTGTASTYASTVMADGAVGYYRLGEANGTYSADSTGTDLGRYNQGTGCATLGQTGALTTDSSTSVLTAGCYAALVGNPNNALPTGSSPRSIAIWYKPNSTACWNQVMGYGDQNSYQGFGLWACPTEVYFHGWSDDTTFSSLGGKNLDDGNWHQIVITYDGSTAISLYVDGTAIGTQSISQPLNTPPDTWLYLGASVGSYGNMNGNIQDAAVFPTQLSASQVSALYAAR